MADGAVSNVHAKLPVRLKCICGTVLKVPERMLNRQGRCPSCERRYLFLPPEVRKPVPPIPKRAPSPFRTPDRASKVEKKELDLYVGLDYGTSTVKCIVRADVRGVNRIPQTSYHVVPVDGYLLFPSVLWQQGERVHIGDIAPAEGARPFRSAKACLRCMVLDEPCSLCRKGKYDGTSLDAEVVSWTIVSHAVNCVRDWIKKQFSEKEYAYTWDQVEWKMGAPLDGLGQIELKQLFADTLWRAVKGGAIVKPTMDVKDALSAFESVRAMHTPAEEETRCLVEPEAIVAMTAFLESREHRSPPSGLYYICDAGAGTLDVAFFRYSPDAARLMSCYDTSCTRAGGDSFASIVARQVAALDGCSYAEAFNDAVRAMPSGGIEAVTGHDGDARVTAELKKVLRSMRLGRNRAFDRSRTKERSWEHWKGVRAVVIGGAKNLPGVVEAVTETIPGGHPHDHIRPELYDFSFSHIKGATELHGIAYGLAIPAANYPDYWQPCEVLPIAEDSGAPRDGISGEDQYTTTG